MPYPRGMRMRPRIPIAWLPFTPWNGGSNSWVVSLVSAAIASLFLVFATQILPHVAKTTFGVSLEQMEENLGEPLHCGDAFVCTVARCSVCLTGYRGRFGPSFGTPCLSFLCRGGRAVPFGEQHHPTGWFRAASRQPPPLCTAGSHLSPCVVRGRQRKRVRGTQSGHRGIVTQDRPSNRPIADYCQSAVPRFSRCVYRK